MIHTGAGISTAAGKLCITCITCNMRYGIWHISDVAVAQQNYTSTWDGAMIYACRTYVCPEMHVMSTYQALKSSSGL